jgi:DNA-binding transcriptional regulator LsrR (DeoR family)
MPNLDRHEILKICYLYYTQNKKQDEISQTMGISRIKVSRALKEARDKGIVSITINDPLVNLAELEVALANRFSLKEAVVIRLKEIPGKSAYEQIGEAGARYLGRVISHYSVISIAWGMTLRHVIQRMNEIGDRNHIIVQLSGGAGIGEESDVNLLTTMLSQKIKSKLYFVQSPMVVRNRETRDAFLKEQRVRESLSVAAKSDLALLGIGPISKEGRLWKAGLMNQADYSALRKAGAVGAICGRCFDKDGNPCQTKWEDRVVGLKLDQIKNIPHKVGIAFGQEKTDCILAALRGGYVDVLITDEETTRSVLSQGLEK